MGSSGAFGNGFGPPLLVLCWDNSGFQYSGFTNGDEIFGWDRMVCEGGEVGAVHDARKKRLGGFQYVLRLAEDTLFVLNHFWCGLSVSEE